MYNKTTLSQSLKMALTALVLLFGACSKEQPKQVKLDSGLKTEHALILEGNCGSARVRIRQKMATHGETPDTLFLMGFSYHQEQKYGKAVEWLQKSVHANGRIYPPALHFLGWSYLYLGEVLASKKAFDDFLLVNPDEPDSMFALGLLSMELGDLNHAGELFAMVSSLAPHDKLMQAKASARWADVLAEQGNWLEAVSKYKHSLELNPDLYEAWYRFSQALKRIGLENESAVALQSFQEARHRVHPEWQATRFPE